MMDKVALRNFILSVVKPLKSGKIVSQTSGDTTASCDNLPPDGGFSDKFRLTSPFGFISGVPKGVSAFYQALFGSGFESIILGTVHKLRPSPTPGQAILYSTTADGTQIKVQISLNPDGTLTISSPGNISITTQGNATITASGTCTVNSTGKTSVTASEIDLNGSGGLILTTETDPIVDMIYGAPTVGVPTVKAGT